jgi:hypothetical protein
VVVWAVKKLFFDEDTEKKPETAPTNTETESHRKEAETTHKIPAFHSIPAEIPVKFAVVPIPSAPKPFIPPLSVAPAPVPAAIAIPKIVAQAPPLPPIKKKFVTREDIATVFYHGARPLTRPAAVAALKSLGFGKTAAYDALSPDGRFAPWLQCAPDGIITWKG